MQLWHIFFAASPELSRHLARQLARQRRIVIGRHDNGRSEIRNIEPRLDGRETRGEHLRMRLNPLQAAFKIGAMPLDASVFARSTGKTPCTRTSAVTGAPPVRIR